MRFDWDANKAVRNRRKHGVSFEEAVTIFGPQVPVIYEDVDHSDTEDRYYALGISDRKRLLTVCFAYRGEAVRLISARRANSQEAVIYAEEIARR